MNAPTTNITRRILANDLYIQLTNGRTAQVIDGYENGPRIMLVIRDVEDGRSVDISLDSTETSRLENACRRGDRTFIRSNS